MVQVEALKIGNNSSIPGTLYFSRRPRTVPVQPQELLGGGWLAICLEEREGFTTRASVLVLRGI